MKSTMNWLDDFHDDYQQSILMYVLINCAARELHWHSMEATDILDVVRPVSK